MKAPRVAVYLLMPVEHSEADAYGIWIIVDDLLFIHPRAFETLAEAEQVAQATRDALWGKP